MRVLHLLALVVVLLAAAPAAARLPTVTHDGRPYVELTRIASTLGSPLEAPPDSTQARLRANGRLVVFTRNWSRVIVDGTPVVLDAPVRVRQGVWLVPEAFVVQIMPQLAAAASPAARPAPVAPATPAVPAPPGAPPAAPVTLEDLRYRSYPSFTRLVLETSAPLEHRIEVTGPREVRIRLSRLDAAVQAEEIADGLVAEARLERAGADALLRIVFEGTPGELKVLTLSDPPRLVLDFNRPVEPAPGERLSPLRLIVLDAGHGGHDSGAVGPGGLMEKELVLDVTRRVARLVEARLGVKVLLSREDDRFVPLRERTSFANRERADLFVSIHANAHRYANSSGVETYFLSSEATDNAARQVAALENDVVQLEKTTARGRADVVRTILWDLAQSEFQHESSRLAEVVQDSMTQALRIPNRGVKQAGFYVLGGAAMPAILIEIGFVTNPREERRLKDSKYRDEIARAIFAGLADHKRAWDQRARTAAERSR